MSQATGADTARQGNLIRRWAAYVAGIYILTLGISLAIRAGIGISPQSSLTRTMTLILPFSQGTFNLALEVLMLLLTFLIAMRWFKPRHLLSMVPAVILASLLDLNLFLTEWVHVEVYPARFALLVFADGIMAFGLFLMVRAKLVLMPIDMFVDTLQKKTGLKWGNLKTMFDCTLLLISATIGLVFLGAPQFIREGTLLNAILVGQYIKLYFWIAEKLAARRGLVESAARSGAANASAGATAAAATEAGNVDSAARERARAEVATDPGDETGPPSPRVHSSERH